MGDRPRAGFQDINIIQINPSKRQKGSEESSDKSCLVCKILCGVMLIGVAAFIGYKICIWCGLLDSCCQRVFIIDCCDFDFEVSSDAKPDASVGASEFVHSYGGRL